MAKPFATGAGTPNKCGGGHLPLGKMDFLGLRGKMGEPEVNKLAGNGSFGGNPGVVLPGGGS